jgi:hypothetical protein
MQTSSIRALAGLRIAVGALFVIFGEYKVVGTQFTLGGGFQYWIGRFLQDGECCIELVVSKVRREAVSILSFELRQATGESLPAYEPGSQ